MDELRIELTGIPTEGRHGANPGERDFPQAFVVDLDVLIEYSEDSLDTTLDYRILPQVVKDTVASSSFDLLESLALAVASAMFEYPTVLEATATVHKPGAAKNMSVADVAASATVGS
jgi:7,8-dihydroneopterin aldolase/epimerase/oxygenase